MRKILPLLLLLLAACQPATTTLPPTQPYSVVQTSAAQTVESYLLASPTRPVPTSTPSPTASPDQDKATVTPDTATGSATQELTTVTPIVVANQSPTVTRTATVLPNCPSGLETRLKVGEQASVSSDPPTPNNVRAGPSTKNTRRGKIQPGEVVEILSGPECGEDIIWWEVRSLSTGLTGWTAEGTIGEYWLAPVD